MLKFYKQGICLLPPPGGYAIGSVYLFIYLFICLSVCQQNYSKTTGRIFMKFSGEVDMGHWRNPLIFVKGRVKGQGPGH